MNAAAGRIAPGDRVRASTFDSGEGRVRRVIADAVYVQWDDPGQPSDNPISLRALEKIGAPAEAAPAQEAGWQESPPLSAYGADPDAGRGPVVVNGAARISTFRQRLRPLGAIRPDLSSTYLVKNWIDQGAASVIFGNPKAGKTFLALDLAFHVAAGWDWRGHRVRGRGHVLYLAGEGGRGIERRIAAIQHAAPELAKAASEHFFLLPVGVDFCGEGDARHLIEAIEGREWRLIVIDTLARAMGAGDENTAKDMGAFIRNVDHLREQTGAHAMMIHHSGKDIARGARGSNSLDAAVDTVIKIVSDEGIRTAETVLQREMEAGATFTYTLRGVEIGRDQDGDPVTSAVIEAADPPEEAPDRKGLGKNQRIALEALQQWAADHGRPCPSGTGWPEPGSRQIVERDGFLGFLAGKMTNDEAKDRRKSAETAVKGLIGRGLVQTNQGHLWIV